MGGPGSARWWWLRAVAAVAVLALTAACGRLPGGDGGDGSGPLTGTDGEEDAGPPRRGGHLVYGLETDPNGLDPTRNAFDPVGIQVANALYDPLAAFDASGTPRPYLAQVIEPIAGTDSTSWRVLLRPGVRFQSGQPLDAPALKTYVEAVTGEYIDPRTREKRPSITQEAARYIDRVDIVGPLELLIHMRKPWATFPALLTGQGGYVISARQIDDPEGHSVPDGTGPFVLRSWKPGSRIELVRNPAYWREGLPYLDGVDFEVQPDGGARIAALERGTIDVVSAGNVDEVQRLDQVVAEQRARGGGNLRIERDPGPSEAVVVMLNTLKRPLDDELVRRALAYATDVEALARATGWGRDRIITGPFAPTSPWYVPTDMPRFDIDKAKALIDEYKHKTGAREVSFELIGISQLPMLNQLREQWAQAGITVRVSTTDFRRSVPLAVGGNYDAIQYRYFSAVDPDSLYHFFTSETRRPAGQIGLNFTRFANDAIDQALIKGRSTTEPAVRREAYAVVQRELAEHVPYLWLFRSEWVVGRTSRVHDARNVTLPDGTKALPFETGTHRLTETWVAG